MKLLSSVLCISNPSPDLIIMEGQSLYRQHAAQPKRWQEIKLSRQAYAICPGLQIHKCGYTACSGQTAAVSSCQKWAAQKQEVFEL